jgi:hypothetical protein
MFQHGTRLATEKRFHRPPVHVPFAMVLDEDMSERIGAIETEYAGIKFRSRLEARWAVFFDSCGMDWKYELEGFEANGHRYLPDFYLPGPKTWCEVKGDPEGIFKDSEKIAAVLSSGVIPGGELLLLNDIPRAGAASSTLVAHPFLKKQEDTNRVDRQWGVFMDIERGQPVNFYGLGGASTLGALMGVLAVEGIAPGADAKNWSAETATLAGPFSWGRRVIDAYAAAASARFEHGQKGA